MENTTVHRFYRIVRSNPPTELDFWSYVRWGIPLLDPNKRHEAEGVSVYRVLKDAQRKAQKYPDKGEYIAVLHMRAGQGITFAKTGRRRESHYTLWGEPSVLLGCVVDVIPVAGEMNDGNDI